MSPPTLAVSAEQTFCLRSGLNTEVIDAVADLHYELELAPGHGRKASREGLLARLDRLRALLDNLGWETPEVQSDAQIDLADHRKAILEALTAELTSAVDQLLGGIEEDAKREASGKPWRHEVIADGVSALRDLSAIVRLFERAWGPAAD